MEITPFLKELVHEALKEDIGKGDITTYALAPKKKNAKAIMYAREKAIVAGLDVAIEVFRQLDGKIKAKKFVSDGQKVKKNQPLLELKGNVRVLLSGERTALNFLQHLSGVATLTREYVDAVKPCKVKILDTRKTIPGMRTLEKYAVKMGGGQNHRMGLWEMVLIKDNHLQLLMPGEKIQTIVQRIRKKIPKDMMIEVETKNLKEVDDALRSGLRILMLDNMNVKQIRTAIKFIDRRCKELGRKKPTVEVSGGVSLEKIKNIAMTGVDWISVGRLTHSVPARDISLEII